MLRKSELGAAQKANPPLGGFTSGVSQFSHVFQSPGPIYEPGSHTTKDWWRFARFLHAAGISSSDVVQNCFSYHLTPAGIMFENGATALGAGVLPAGTGQTELQVRAAADIGCTAYAGTPDYLKVILDKADEMGERLRFAKAAVGGGALFPSLRQEYADRGIACLQCYGTADLGNIAYESPAMEGMIVDEGVIVGETVSFIELEADGVRLVEMEGVYEGLREDKPASEVSGPSSSSVAGVGSGTPPSSSMASSTDGRVPTSPRCIRL